MKIPIRVSEIMTVFGQDGIIRLPQDARDLFSLRPNQYIHSVDCNGNTRSFKVAHSFGRDVMKDSLSAYVSQRTYDALQKDENGWVYVRVATEITLGCDPEFFLVDRSNNKVISASRLFRNKNADLGYDGVMVELRPRPHVFEHEVALNMWGLIRKARDEINSKYNGPGEDPRNLRMIGTSFLTLNQQVGGFTAGFHLHYGLPRAILGNAGFNTPKGRIARQIIKVLDYYVGLPATIPEDNFEVPRRANPHIQYGKPGTFRMDSRTLEYRTPGGAMLRHPIYTIGLLGLGALVVQDLMMRMSDWSDSFARIEQLANADIRECYPHLPKTPQEIFQMICSTNNKAAMDHLETIANDLTQMHGFEKRRRSVETLLHALSQGKGFDRDIELNWREYYHAKQPESVAVC